MKYTKCLEVVQSHLQLQSGHGSVVLQRRLKLDWKQIKITLIGDNKKIIFFKNKLPLPQQTFASLFLTDSTVCAKNHMHDNKVHTGLQNNKNKLLSFQILVNMKICIVISLFFRSKMKKIFLKFYDSYCKIVDENMPLNGKKMKVINKTWPIARFYLFS